MNTNLDILDQYALALLIRQSEEITPSVSSHGGIGSLEALDGTDAVRLRPTARLASGTSSTNNNLDIW